MMSAPSHLSIQERFEYLLLSPKLLQKRLGKIKPGEVVFEQSEQAEARRQLLGIEQAAIHSRDSYSNAHHSHLEKLQSEMLSHISNEIDTAIDNPGYLIESLLSLDYHVPLLLDLLACNTVRVSQLFSHAQHLPFLTHALINRVNKPDFRRQDEYGNEITVKSLKTAMSFIGIDNLKTLIPYYVLKHTLPAAYGAILPTNQLFLQYAVGTATSAKTLAQSTQNVSPYEAFVLGLLSNLGRHAVITLYIRSFERWQTTLLKRAHRDMQRQRHDQLLALTPCPKQLVWLQQHYADRITAQIINAMHLSHLNLVEPMTMLAENALSNRTSLADIVQQARRYCEIKMLHQHRCLSKTEAREAIRNMRLLPGSIKLLTSTTIFTPPLNLKRVDAHAFEN